jgi:hypothetical protein
MKKLFLTLICLLVLFSQLTFTDVPPPATRQPAVPYFMEPWQFKTMQLQIFSSDVSGMVTDAYGDLYWNPAYLSRINNRMIYFDLNLSGTRSAESSASSFRSDIYLVYPSWYSQTYISGIQTEPLYNFALILPLNNQLSISIINRSLFDYGPFRQTYYWDYRNALAESYLNTMDIAKDLEPQRLEVNDNQQILYGTQTEISAAYHISNLLDLGVKIGNYLYHRDGDLYDSKWGYYPHYSFADLNDENLKINGQHNLIGIGLLFHPNQKTTLGVYGELISGKSDETTTSIDSSDSWSEKDSDDDYYSIYSYDLLDDQSYETNAKCPTWTLSFERQLSDKLTLRTFLRHSNSNNDINFSTSSEDTSFSDRTYDTYDNGDYHFQRSISLAANRQHFAGEGTDKSSNWRWFASLIYHTENDWTLFSGIQINQYSNEKKYREDSDYYAASDYNYLYYDPHTRQYLSSHSRYYEYTYQAKQYSAIIPVGIKARVVKGFYLILGIELGYYLTDDEECGKLLYPKIDSKRWENGSLVVDDPETDRYEEYSSNPAKDLTRSANVNLGIAYKHPSGINLFVRSNGNILEADSWDLGFEYQW